MLLIIIPLVFNILFLWYIRSNLTFSDNAEEIVKIPRWSIILSVLLSIIPIVGIIVTIIWVFVLFFKGAEGDISYRDTKLNKFLR